MQTAAKNSLKLIMTMALAFRLDLKEMSYIQRLSLKRPQPQVKNSKFLFTANTTIKLQVFTRRHVKKNHPTGRRKRQKCVKTGSKTSASTETHVPSLTGKNFCLKRHTQPQSTKLFCASHTTVHHFIASTVRDASLLTSLAISAKLIAVFRQTRGILICSLKMFSRCKSDSIMLPSLILSLSMQQCLKSKCDYC